MSIIHHYSCCPKYAFKLFSHLQCMTQSILFFVCVYVSFMRSDWLQSMDITPPGTRTLFSVMFDMFDVDVRQINLTPMPADGMLVCVQRVRFEVCLSKNPTHFLLFFLSPLFLLNLYYQYF